jgi:hypothetical protein
MPWAHLGHRMEYRKCPRSVFDLSRLLVLAQWMTHRKVNWCDGFASLLFVKCHYLLSRLLNADSGSIPAASTTDRLVGLFESLPVRTNRLAIRL